MLKSEKGWLRIFLALVLCLSAIKVSAHQNLVIIPLGGGVTPASSNGAPENQVIVAKSGGDYTSIQVAADYAAGRASVSRPWTVLVAPGVYNLVQTLQLRPHVRLIGSGRYATRLTAAISG